MKKQGVALFFLAATGVALACSQKPIPPMPLIKVSALDLAWAAGQKFQNPAYAAAMRNLDSRASDMVGASNWKTNNFVGYVQFSTPLGGAGIAHVNKPCDKKAVEQAPCVRLLVAPIEPTAPGAMRERIGTIRTSI